MEKNWKVFSFVVFNIDICLSPGQLSKFNVKHIFGGKGLIFSYITKNILGGRWRRRECPRHCWSSLDQGLPVQKKTRF